MNSEWKLLKAKSYMLIVGCRFLLAYERHEKGEEDKPLPTLERRRLKSRQSGTGSSDSESGPDTPSTSRSSTSPPVGTENKVCDFFNVEIH